MNGCINKKEFINAVYTKFKDNGDKQTKDHINEMFETFIATIKESLQEGKEVKFMGFGKWFPKLRAARKTINPKTKEPVDVPEKTVVKWKTFNGMNEILN